MALPTVDTELATTAIAAEGAVMSNELDKIDDTLVSVFDILADMAKVNQRIAVAVEGMFEIDADRWKEETLGEGLALERAREEIQPQEDLTGNGKDSMFDKAMDKVAKEASTLGLVLAALAAGFIAFTDELPDWLKRLLGVEKTAKQYDTQRQATEVAQERSLLGANEYIGPDFIGRAMDSYSSEMDFLRADEKRKNPNLSQEAIDYNAEQRRMGGVYRMDESDNVIQVDSSFLEKYITGRDDPALQEYREKRERIESLIEQRNDILESYETVLKEKQTLLAAGMSPSHPEYEKLVYKQNTIVERIESIDQQLKPLIPGATETLEQTAPKDAKPKIEPKVEPTTQITPPEQKVNKMDELNTGSAASGLIDRSARTANPSSSPEVTKSIAEGSQQTAGNVNIITDNSDKSTTVIQGGGNGGGAGRSVPNSSKQTKTPGSSGSTELTDFVNGSF